MKVKPDTTHNHNRNLCGFDGAHDPAFVVFVGDQSSEGRKQKERQDEQPRRCVDEKPAFGFRRRPVSQQDHHRILKNVIVERACALSQEKRPKASLHEQLRDGHEGFALWLSVRFH